MRINYAYDNNENLKTIAWSQKGVDSFIPYSRLTVTSLDDKPSPFSAVKGYQFAAFPMAYAPEYGLAFCKNNPLEIVEEVVDPATKQWTLYARTTFAYEYNDNGYPTKIAAATTYHTTAGASTFYKTYVYTYK
ncbi:hypothetical protein [Olivibacter sitiensis]|uniref:hypothetical protein n=1 Tax=Olivibacter sitiensis TaxID=376470 RepID=UPI0003FE6DA7|nr:hypothetical protein [Olivibacter sitiensis]